MEALFFYEVCDFFEDSRFVFGQFGKDFSVEFDAFVFKSVYERGVFKAVFAGGRIYLNVPKAAEISFFEFAALKSV